jgi:hypothetical protein
MIGLLALSTAAVAPLTTNDAFPCEGIRMVEASTRDRPLAFSTLRQMDKAMATVRDATGKRVQREITVTNVKPIAGFSNCRFVYSAQIDLACYIGTTLPENDEAAIAAKLESISDSAGHCLTNKALVRSPSEPGSTPSITFGAGPTQSFWQISMVPTRADPSRIQPEVMVLGPSPFVTVARPTKSAAKKKRKAR